MHLNSPGARYFFITLLIIITILSALIIAPILSAITFAFLTALIFHPLYQFFFRWTGKRPRIATPLTMVVIFVSFLLPIILLTQLTVQQVIQFNNDLRTVTASRDINLENGVELINENLVLFGLSHYQVTELEAQTAINNAASNAAHAILNTLVRTGANTIEVLAQVFVYLFLLYFLIPIQSKIPKALIGISPLSDDIDRLFITKALAMAKSMIKGTFVIAVVQALFGGLLLSFFGAPYVIFWVMLMTFLGIIPIVGASTVLLPAGVLYLLGGNIVAGITILIVTLIIISNIDYVLRPRLVSKQAHLHDALILIGVLGGLKTFGILGVIYGPVIMILLTSVLQVYQATKKDLNGSDLSNATFANKLSSTKKS
ncbi:MAG: AI-2E family transporter [Patescibacteria group bacterium]